MQPPRPPLPLGRIFLVGVIVPSLFAWIDYELLQGLQSGAAWPPAVIAVFIVQVAALGLLVGRLIDWPVLRAWIYGWGWLFLNAQVLTAALQPNHARQVQILAKLVPAIGGAQIGLLVMWAMLATRPHWALRWPVATMLCALLTLLYASERTGLIAIQTPVLMLICGILVWQSFRLFRPVEDPSPAATGREAAMLSRVQFGVRHVLIWTTSAAIVLGMLKGLDLLSLRGIRILRHPEMLTIGTTACLTAIVLVVSLWAGLGSGPAWLRWPLGAFGGLLAGGIFAYAHWITRSPFGRIPRNRYPTSAWEQFWNLEWEHITWLGLAGALLFAGLLYFRSQGVRLGRMLKPRTGVKT